MTDVADILISPRTHDEWLAYHTIRRTVLFENRGEVGVYIENHPDEFERGHHPMILVHNGLTIGVIRVDLAKPVAWFCRVAIREDLQRCGHGRALLRLAECFAQRQGCNEIRSNVAADAVGFYERCGYSRNTLTASDASAVPMTKRVP